MKLLRQRELFQGDINLCQDIALVYLYSQDAKEARQNLMLEALAANPGSNPKLIEQLSGEIFTPQDETEEWFTPRTAEDLAYAEDFFSGIPTSALT